LEASGFHDITVALDTGTVPSGVAGEIIRISWGTYIHIENPPIPVEALPESLNDFVPPNWETPTPR